MFYANNEQVKGIFLNGRNYNYLVYGFGKIIPEDRNSVQLNLNLAYKYLNQYRIEYGTVKDGYENALVSPRMDKPDSNGVFHTPFTYYYGGNIVPTKEVNILITNGSFALSNALVYNDININGAINYFATNTDFLGHNVNVFPEKDSFQVYQALLNYEMLNNCGNFDLNIETRFSKGMYPTLYNCNNFSGNFKYVGSADNNYPGFRGFLVGCKDGVFNIDCTNMHGGGSDANVINYYIFSGIQGCENMNVNITGSSWQAWVHPYCYSGNCNINTRYIVPGFDRMDHCNFNLYMPDHADVEKSAPYSILSKSSNCNVYFDGINSNIYSFRNNDMNLFLFEDLNDCNLNLLLNNSVGLDYGFGNRLNNCNIHFMSIGFKQQGFGFMSNCTLTGNFNYANIWAAFVYSSRNVNLDINARYTSDMILVWNVDSVTGNVNLSNDTNINACSNSILNLYYGDYILFNDVDNCKFKLDNAHNVDINGAYNSNFNLYNCYGYSKLSRLNNVTFIDIHDKSTVTNLDNCYNSRIYARTVHGLIENVYNTYLNINEVTEYNTVNVYNCDMGGFPCSASYHTENCTFRTSIENAQIRFRSYITWANVWPHATPRGSDGWDTWYSTNAGLGSTANLSRCYLNNNNASLVNSSSISFDNNKNMIMSLLTFYNGPVKVNLPKYATNIKLNIDCRNLNLGVFMAGPPHGLEYSSISADNIYCTTGNNYFVQMNYGTRIYCENYCNVAFSPVRRRFSDNYQPVMLINNYQLTNGAACRFYGGIARIGRLSGYTSVPLELYNGACVFINNTVLSATTVNNALLFLGTNVRIDGITDVTNGGLVVNKANYSMSDISKFVNRKNFAWNFSDSGPWGSQSLFDYCINV